MRSVEPILTFIVMVYPEMFFAVLDLFRSSLRLRPDRIIIGEVQGGEALDVIQSMTSGHAGSMTTLHANMAMDALNRLETLAMMSKIELPLHALRAQVASAIDVIVQVQRLTGGPRKLVSVTEVQGMEGDTITMQDIFTFEQLGISKGMRAYGQFVATGIRPSFLERVAAAGAEVDTDLFERQVLMSDQDEEEQEDE